MKVFKAAFAVLLVMLLSPHSQQLEFPLESEDDICRLFPNNAVLRKPGTCTETIVCQDGLTTKGTQCTTSGQVWNLDGSCGKLATTDTYCAGTNCKKNGDTWVAGVRNCQDWVKCDGATKLSDGTCPTGQVFSQALQMCIYQTSDYVCDVKFDICNLSPINQVFWDEDNCHKYYRCIKSQKLEVVTCPTGTYYDVRSGVCIAKAQVNCYKHPFPEDVCGTTKLAKRNRFVDDQATCRGYFYCRDLGSGVPDTSPAWAQCPEDKFFDGILEVCKDRAHVQCDEDRCDGRLSGRELSETSGCQHYLECENGYTIAELKCPDNKYFDAINQECVDTKMSYDICA